MKLVCLKQISHLHTIRKAYWCHSQLSQRNPSSPLLATEPSSPPSSKEIYSFLSPDSTPRPQISIARSKGAVLLSDMGTNKEIHRNFLKQGGGILKHNYYEEGIKGEEVASPVPGTRSPCWNLELGPWFVLSFRIVGNKLGPSPLELENVGRTVTNTLASAGRSGLWLCAYRPKENTANSIPPWTVLRFSLILSGITDGAKKKWVATRQHNTHYWHKCCCCMVCAGFCCGILLLPLF